MENRSYLRRGLVVFCLLASLFAMVACSNPGTSNQKPKACLADSDCGEGSWCISNFCVKAGGERTVTPTEKTPTEGKTTEETVGKEQIGEEQTTPEGDASVNPEPQGEGGGPDDLPEGFNPETPVDEPCTDEDKDGFCKEASDPARRDCDDKNDKIYPGATELCDGVDNNCNGQTDETFEDQDAACSDSTQQGICGEGKKACESGKVVCKLNKATQEECNGKDDDCDGQVDNGTTGEGDDCSTGKPGICAAGKRKCVAGQFTCEANNQPEKEVCDQKDNDCNGQVDEGCKCTTGDKRACYTGAAGTDGVGLCKKGTQECVAGQWGACVGEVVPTQEVCDTKDNDCDGKIDEDFPGVGDACKGSQPGICQAGTKKCVKGQEICESTQTPQKEVCNQKDDDCNGVTDDGDVCGVCKAGTTQSCYNGPAGTAGVGVCVKGKQTCDAKGQWGACQGAVEPTSEVCDGKDNDCDGLLDESDPKVGTSCKTNKPGVCAAGVFICGNGALSCSPISQPQPETCDQKDNDCDGQVDEGGVCGVCKDGDLRKCYTGPSGTLGNGACQQGTQKCVSGQWEQSCNGQVLPQTETCDGKDNDCDGQIDEGVSTTYYKDGDGDRFGDPKVSRNACNRPNGYVTNKDDCDDSDRDARPNQQNYFTSQRNSGGFDYNCNGTTEYRYANRVGSCRKNGGGCTVTTGWRGSTPACGASGSYIYGCYRVNGNCYESRTYRRQSCR
ncbi:MAG: hypothetical protein CL932_00185 [Deltaproteobacteria bacterium]|nr:hypothetical protein [Deltaproteobacteria bacterium]|tara:strand:- start:3870 stop:6050 length:2181 start_codon:yes stop_codon:yes gene_type:complete